MNNALQVYLAATRADFKVFLLQAFRTINPGQLFLDNWHIDAIVHCLEQAIEGKKPRLIINLPPRQLKSFLASVIFPAFILGLDPTARIVCVSYSDELAKALSRAFKRLVESLWYRKVFPHVKPTKSTQNEFATEQGGNRYATSVGGTLTGRGGDFIIIDDPIKPEDALSDKARQSTNDWFRSTLLSRLDDKKRSVLILVMQRLHVNDLTAFVEAGGGFHKLSLSALATQDEVIPMSSTKYHRRKQGEALHPEREDVETLEAIRDQIGTGNFASQYQQRPESPEGGMFKSKWLQLIGEPPAMAPEGILSVSIDSALSTSETADYSAISFVYSDVRGHYVLSAKRGRWDYESLRDKALQYVRCYGKEIYFLVEAAGSGISLISFLRKAGYNCFHHRPRDEKQTRAAFAVPIMHARRVFIVNKEGENGWVEPFINELVTFPQARFDDQVDSLVQVLLWAEPRVNPGSRFYTLG